MVSVQPLEVGEAWPERELTRPPRRAGRPGGHGRPGGARLRRLVGRSARPAGIFLASRLGILAVFGAAIYGRRDSLASALSAWDARWYLAVARSGYPHLLPVAFGDAAQSTLGFFPLLPLMIRAVAALTRLSYLTSGLLVTTFAGLAAALTVWRLLADTEGRAAADRGTALVLLSPGAFVLSMVYSEGLMIALVAGSLLSLRRRRWLVAGALAALASATDPLGAAAIAPCTLAAYVAVRDRREWRALLAPVVAPLGVVAFFAFLWAWTGTPLAWFVAQRHGWESGPLGSGVVSQLSYLFHHGFANVNANVKVASALVLLVLVVVASRRARPEPMLVAYVAAVLALALLAPTVGLSPRVALRAFPILGIVGARLRRGWFEGVIGASALTMAALAVLSLGSGAFTP